MTFEVDEQGNVNDGLRVSTSGMLVVVALNGKETVGLAKVVEVRLLF